MEKLSLVNISLISPKKWISIPTHFSCLLFKLNDKEERNLTFRALQMKPKQTNGLILTLLLKWWNNNTTFHFEKFQTFQFEILKVFQIHIFPKDVAYLSSVS